MAFTDKPDAVPTFASSDVVDGVTGTNNVVEPDAAKKATGWLFMEYPARNIMNWLHRKTYQWVNYFEQFWTDAHTFLIDTITEYTTDNGVDIEGVHLENSILEVDTITEQTGSNGVDIESINITDYKINGTYYINTQAGFNAIIEEVAGSQWQFIDDVKSLVLDFLTGGYQMDDDGDYLETNNCKNIEMRGGAYLDFNNGNGYIKVNTDNCLLRNVDVQGTGTVASAIAQSFLLNANYVTFDNCRTSSRLSNTNFSGFAGSGTTLHNYTSKYINCSVYDITTSGTCQGFNSCYNGFNILSYNLESTNNYVAGIISCNNFGNVLVYQLDAANNNTIGIASGSNIVNSWIEDLDSSTDESRGINNANRIVNSYIYDLQSAANADIYGIRATDNISNVKIQQLDTSGTGVVYGMNGCNQASSIEMVDLDGADDVYGVYQCNQLSSIHIEDLDSSGGEVQGIYDSDQISASYIYDLLAPADSDIYGMNTVNNVAACKINQLDTSGTGDVYGIRDSFQCSAFEVVDLDGAAIVYGIEDTDQMSAFYIHDIDSSGAQSYGISGSNQFSAFSVYDVEATSQTAYGIRTCNRISACFINQIDYSGVGGLSAYGIFESNQISSIYVDDIDVGGAGVVEGIGSCEYVSSALSTEAANANCDYVDTDDANITNNYSTPVNGDAIWT